METATDAVYERGLERMRDMWGDEPTQMLAEGVTVDELREVVKHVTAYAGAPAGVDVAMAADRVLAGDE